MLHVLLDVHKGLGIFFKIHFSKYLLLYIACEMYWNVHPIDICDNN